MDHIDRHIASIIQSDGRVSNADIAETVGVSVSTASERVRRLVADGVITAWRGVLDADELDARLLAFIFVDMTYEGEAGALQELIKHDEVQEMHHVSGAHSYFLKVRVADTSALQAFLQDTIKPLKAIVKTETIVVLDTAKETTEIMIPGLSHTSAAK